MSRKEALTHLTWASLVCYVAYARRAGSVLEVYASHMGMTTDQMSAWASGATVALFIGVCVGWAFGRYHGYTLGLREHTRPFTKVDP